MNRASETVNVNCMKYVHWGFRRRGERNKGRKSIRRNNGKNFLLNMLGKFIYRYKKCNRCQS